MPFMRRTMRPSSFWWRYGSLLLISQVCMVQSGILWAQNLERLPDKVFAVQVERNTLTVDVRSVPLAQVLHAISEQAGLRLTLLGDVSHWLSAKFEAKVYDG